MNGIVVLNKEKGISSNTACKKVGRLLNEKKVGHLGTLDPMAEGVLPVSLGKCTKLFDYFLNKDKEYIADFTFGFETNTLDAEGEIIDSTSIIPSAKDIENQLEKMLGVQNQMPPKFSAKKVNGIRAYDLARQNVDFDLKPKEVNLINLKLIDSLENNTYRILIQCSSGTYVRSICRDLAYALDSCAYMSKLVRTRCGIFKIEDSYKFDEVNNGCVVGVNEILKDNKKIVMNNENEYEKFLNTGVFEFCDNDFDAVIEDVVLEYKGEIISIGTQYMGYYKSRIRFV